MLRWRTSGRLDGCAISPHSLSLSLFAKLERERERGDSREDEAKDKEEGREGMSERIYLDSRHRVPRAFHPRSGTRRMRREMLSSGSLTRSTRRCIHYRCHSRRAFNVVCKWATSRRANKTKQNRTNEQTMDRKTKYEVKICGKMDFKHYYTHV